MDISQSDPVAEWNPSGDQTGLEEPMWRLGLDGGSDSYPERPDESDCIYYLRTGFCGYGSRCRFNHPRDRGSVFGAMRSGGDEYPERIGEPVCQYYMRTGICKFGASCKYHHPRHGVGSSTTIPLNISGYPLRPGEKECSYYVKTGQCKFGATCKFHHPQPTTIIPPPPPPLPQAPPLQPPPESLHSALYPSPVASSQQYGVFSRPSILPGPYLPGPYSPLLLPPGMVPLPGWNPYQAPVGPTASPNTIGSGPLYAMRPHLSSPVPSYTGSYPSISSSSKKQHSFPQKPGEPVCQYYLKTGDCKFGPSCRYHHPLELTLQNPNYVLSPMGLPLRPGALVCTHYSQNGVCKFGPACKFDHPMGILSYNSSASSLTDVAIVPYPVGISLATLAPSSSSSDLKPDLISGGSASIPSSLAGSSSSQKMPVSDSTGGTTTTTTATTAHDHTT